MKLTDPKIYVPLVALLMLVAGIYTVYEIKPDLFSSLMKKGEAPASTNKDETSDAKKNKPVIKNKNPVVTGDSSGFSDDTSNDSALDDLGIEDDSNQAVIEDSCLNDTLLIQLSFDAKVWTKCDDGDAQGDAKPIMQLSGSSRSIYISNSGVGEACPTCKNVTTVFKNTTVELKKYSGDGTTNIYYMGTISSKAVGGSTSWVMIGRDPAKSSFTVPQDKDFTKDEMDKFIAVLDKIEVYNQLD